jgi:hypothetical protein
VHVLTVARVVALELREGLRVGVEVPEGEPPPRSASTLRSSQPAGKGMKSPGEASSTLIDSSSFRRGMARRMASCSGTSLRWTSTVVGRQPKRTAVVRQVADAFLLGRCVKRSDELPDPFGVG